MEKSFEIKVAQLLVDLSKEWRTTTPEDFTEVELICEFEEFVRRTSLGAFDGLYTNAVQKQYKRLKNRWRV